MVIQICNPQNSRMTIRETIRVIPYMHYKFICKDANQCYTFTDGSSTQLKQRILHYRRQPNTLKQQKMIMSITM